MLVTDVDSIQPDRIVPGAPVALVQRPSRAAITGLATAAIAATSVLLAPFWLIASRIIAEPATLSLAGEQPLVALQLVFGLIAALGVAGFAMRRLFRLIGRRRDVYIEAGTVTVTDVWFGHAKHWQQPLAAFCGLARVMRSTASGTRHMIVLIHPDARRHVVLTNTARPDGETLAVLMDQFGLPEVSDRLLAAEARTETQGQPMVAEAAGRLAA